MNYDLTPLLADWEYQPGQVIARRFRAKDGVEKIQLRIDLGVMQMNAEGRPDGKRPLGHESWYEAFKAKKKRMEKEGTTDSEDSPAPFSETAQFTLSTEDCTKLQQEAIQYHHRYICLFQLEDFDGVLRDADRNLEVFAFARQHAPTPEAGWSLSQFAPQLLMMRTRAIGTRAIKGKRHDQAIRHIEEGIEALEQFYRDHDREDWIENSAELSSLRFWMQEIRDKRPLSEFERLQRQLDEAIQLEDYEKAAKVRDAMRKLQKNEA